MQSRSFSRSSLQAFQAAAEATRVAELAQDINPAFDGVEYQKLQAYSKTHLRKKQEEAAAEADWLAALRSPQQKEGIFAKISAINDSDHEHVQEVKRKIDKLVHEELSALRFEEQLKKEEAQHLVEDIYTEVKTKSNFYFAINEAKLGQNLKIYNSKAPGNHNRHPSVVLPHEHVHVYHWFDTDNLTEDKKFEIYASYSHMIDLHISQVRP